jgi:hypothetical protein
MSTPKVSDSYPVEMLDAIKRAHETGEVVIPTPTPHLMRLQFNGLRGALRREGKGELADQVAFCISAKGETPTWFKIVLRSASPVIADIATALKGAKIVPSAVEEAEESFNRLLGGSK